MVTCRIRATARRAIGLLVAALLFTANLAAQERSYGVPAIYTMDRDGGNVQFAARVPGMDWHGVAAWSRDGKRIVFDACPEWRNFTRSRVYVATLDGGALDDLGPGCGPTWSFDDSLIAFHIRADNADGLEPGIWMMKSDGTARRRLCDGWRPRWSPNGARLLYVARHEGGNSLFIFDLDTNSSRRILNQPYATVTGGDWSAEGTQVVFIGYREQPYTGELGIITPGERRNDLRIRYSGTIGWTPSWSPDGREIVFFIMEAGARRLHVVAPDGDGEPRMLKNQTSAVYNADPAWSPDGTRMVFARANSAPQ
jgi:Tol biopolymer transport system component